MEPISTLDLYKHELATFADTVPAKIVGARARVTSMPYSVYKESWSDEPRETFLRQLSRPALLDLTKWEGSGTPGSLLKSFQIPKDLIASALKKSRLDYFCFFRYNLKVRFQVNGSRSHLGRLLCVWAPAGYTTGWSKTNEALASLTNLPHVFLDPSVNRSAEMEIPFTYPLLYYQLVGTSSVPFNRYLTEAQKIGVVAIYQLTALSCLTTPVQAIEVTTHAWFEDTTLCIPTAFQAQMGTLEQEEAVLRPSGVVSEIVEGIIPVARNVARVAGSLGFSKPADVTPSSQVSVRTAGSLANAIGSDPINKLTLDPACLTEIAPELSGTGLDEMAITYIGKTYALKSVLTWGPADTDLLGSLELYPPHTAVTNAPNCVTSWLLAAHCFYKGSSRIKIQIVSSAFHSGRLAFVFRPTTSGASPAFLTSSDRAYNVVMDLTGATEMEFEIPYCAPTPVLSTLSFHGVNSGSSSCPPYYIGHLDVYVLNKLVSNATTTPAVSVLAYHSFTDDLEVYAPSLEFVANYVPVSKNVSDATAVYQAFPTQSIPDDVVPTSKKKKARDTSWEEFDDTQNFIRKIRESETQNQASFVADSFGLTRKSSEYVAQSGEQDMVEGSTLTEAQLTDKAIPMFLSSARLGFASKYCFGERVESIAHLIKRYSYRAAIFPQELGASATENPHAYATLDISTDFMSVGGSSVTLDKTDFHTYQATGQNHAAYAWTWLSYFSCIYRFRRGGTRHKILINPAVNADAGVIFLGQRQSYLTKENETWEWQKPYGTEANINDETYANRARIFRGHVASISSGGQVANTTSNCTFEVEQPYYSWMMMKPPFNPTPGVKRADDAKYLFERTIQASPNLSIIYFKNGVSASTSRTPLVHHLVAAADDFQFGFLIPPPLCMVANS